jgi:predicted ATPase
MRTFEKIHIKGFCRLSEVRVELKLLNVISGANGSGKTSLLDVFSLLAASAAGCLNEAISDLGGIGADLTSLLAVTGDKAGFMAFDLAMEVPGYSPIEYRITLAPRGAGYEISDETLTQERGQPQPLNTSRPITVLYDTSSRQARRKVSSRSPRKGRVRPNWDYNPTESALS